MGICAPNSGEMNKKEIKNKYFLQNILELK
jgi:hypothetical protein